MIKKGVHSQKTKRLQATMKKIKRNVYDCIDKIATLKKSNPSLSALICKHDSIKDLINFKLNKKIIKNKN